MTGQKGCEGGDTQVDVPDGHIAIQKRCITIGSDPANDVVQPLMPLQALALAYHRNGKLYLYAFDNEALTGPLYVNGEAWTKESFVPLQVPCEVSHGEVCFYIGGKSLNMRDLLRARGSDTDEELDRNTETNRGKRPREECETTENKRVKRRVSFSTEADMKSDSA
eukprot:GEMP01058430.1.p1 GENE.GEMP01058430.1~~GEMP01058430.1.p1  ORF type:complete len:166 (+),score=30.01 GEMP01058430.1:241-738(+)